MKKSTQKNRMVQHKFFIHLDLKERKKIKIMRKWEKINNNKNSKFIIIITISINIYIYRIFRENNDIDSSSSSDEY